jgi:hypothetical protein
LDAVAVSPDHIVLGDAVFSWVEVSHLSKDVMVAQMAEDQRYLSDIRDAALIGQLAKKANVGRNRVCGENMEHSGALDAVVALITGCPIQGKLILHKESNWHRLWQRQIFVFWELDFVRFFVTRLLIPVHLKVLAECVQLGNGIVASRTGRFIFPGEIGNGG